MQTAIMLGLKNPNLLAVLYEEVRPQGCTAWQMAGIMSGHILSLDYLEDVLRLCCTHRCGRSAVQSGGGESREAGGHLPGWRPGQAPPSPAGGPCLRRSHR